MGNGEQGSTADKLRELWGIEYFSKMHAQTTNGR